MLLVSALMLVALGIGLRSAEAQAPQPSMADSARLLGHLWADGSVDDGVWDATGPSGGSTLIEHLVEQHGGTWVDRSQLRFTLPEPFAWTDWKDSIPDDDARTRQAVGHPNFLAALLEGEGSTAGLVYDQSSCCTPGYTRGRMTSLVALLRERGYSTARLNEFGDPDSGEVTISSSEFSELRRDHEFVCPASGGDVRVPGGEQYERYGDLRWLGPGGQYATVVREDCRPGVSISPVAAPLGDCVATVAAGGRIQLTWSYPRGSIVIRRNGVFVDTVSVLDGRYLDDRPAGDGDYTVRVSWSGRRTDDECGTANTADPVEVAPPPLARCAGKVVTILGTGAADVLDGTVGVDVLHGFGGNDLLRGFGGADVICGGFGNDRLRGGYGNDRLLGGNGADTIVSGPGADVARGGNGPDRIEGNRGADLLEGQGGNDVLRAGSGFDRLFGGQGSDVLRGGPHRDQCTGGWGQDLLAADCETVVQ